MSQDLDIFDNINNLSDNFPVVFEASTQDSPGMSIDDDEPNPKEHANFQSPESSQNSTSDTLNLSDLSGLSNICKKGQGVIKRYQKKQEVVAKKNQKKLMTQTRQSLLVKAMTSTPNSSPKRRRSARLPRSTREQIDDYISIGSPDSPERDNNLITSCSGVTISSVELSGDLDYEITIKLKWKGKIERIQYRHLQPFREFIQMLSERENTDPNKVVLTMNETIISPTDTPSSIGYTSIDFISGRVVLKNLTVNTKKEKTSEIELKFQSDRWKRPLALKVQKESNVENLLQMCAETLKCSTNEIRLIFDGEFLHASMTLHDLELEGGEILDVVLNSDRKM
ncbi:hypothetical protein DMENIID0001_110140 [Sergentomyia squamirostris]